MDYQVVVPGLQSVRAFYCACEPLGVLAPAHLSSPASTRTPGTSSFSSIKRHQKIILCDFVTIKMTILALDALVLRHFTLPKSRLIFF